MLIVVNKQADHLWQINGEMILSTVGLHFYSGSTTVHHIPFQDVLFIREPEPQRSFFARGTYDVGGWVSLPFGGCEYFYFIGQKKMSGGFSHIGRMTAGIYNFAQQIGSKDARATWLEAAREVRKQAPAIPGSKKSPHTDIDQMLYFAEASALGPALFFADQALEYARLLSIVTKGPGFRERGELEMAGYNKNATYPPMSVEDVTFVKRWRAWLLLDGKRYQTLMREGQKQPDSDAEVLLTYAVASALSGNNTSAVLYIERARKLDSANPKVIAAKAWSLALQQKNIEATTESDLAEDTAKGNRQALLIVGFARETLGDLSAALNSYLASAALVQNHIEGAVVCKRAVAVASKIDVQTALLTAQQLTQILPMQREAWEGLVLAAKRMSNEELARQAQERVTMMQG